MSGHAFSTVEEMAAASQRRGLQGFVLTDHGPAIPSSAQPIYFQGLYMLPRILDGSRILRGVEANILDFAGSLDLRPSLLRKLDVVIASFHEIIRRPTTAADHTQAYLALAANPLVDILGHTGRGPYPFDIDAVVQACRDHGTLIEINNHTLARGNPQDQCRRIAAACKTHGVRIVVNSDAHFSRAVGEVASAMELLDSIDFPPDLIVNTSYEKFRADLLNRKPWLQLPD